MMGAQRASCSASVELLLAEHQHGVPVHRRADRLERFAVLDPAQVDARSLAGETQA
jgi:hypothetical protein